jgi:hypothetical protein
MTGLKHDGGSEEEMERINNFTDCKAPVEDICFLNEFAAYFRTIGQVCSFIMQKISIIISALLKSSYLFY